MSTPTVAEMLVSGGRDLIAREGTGDLSVRRLVEAAGRSTMCVYTYFGNRRRLLAEIYRSCAGDLAGALVSVGSPEGFSERYRGYAAEHPRHFQYLFADDLEGLGLDPALRLDLVDSVLDRAGELWGVARSEALPRWLALHGPVWLETVQRLAGQPGRFDTATAGEGGA
ncbi:TetR/AcrR family transcriptional regulator [Myceligenerans pegani]|uniref:TetR family transcriptional regulator n=1 Tax=Myceligenerans pegani TaxID=2776917 RepID=A0ABR9N5M3_9MICO|nr:TetR/AcrR family transcriptional regulator [Myceligenerans sp. TRM 65318]MBE1878971.1 TetR family transcriptional regulator [Myceligenerans sp. TRM 65318]MBE3021242.1 TetR family transcriptional regulator [Myceligenerans sp. TRM 65318]